MADRELKYTFYSENVTDNSLVTYTDVDNAKACIGFSEAWDWTKGTPSWSLSESNTRLVLTWVFTDDQANDQLAVHEAIKDNTWAWSVPGSGHLYFSFKEDDKSYYKAWGVTRTKS